MGIYDREYYRDETSGSGFFSGVAPACKTIILINVALFIAKWTSPNFDVFNQLEANSNDVFLKFHVWQLLTATFLHASPFHLLWNMLFLWMAGREVEAIYGSREFTFLYLIAAVSSTLCALVIDRLGPHPGEIHMLGASGAVLAVVVIFAMYYPRREVLLFFILPVEIWLLVVIYIGLDALSLLQEMRGIGGATTGFAAHLGGAAYGYLYKRFDLRVSHFFDRRRRRPRLRVVSAEPRDLDRVSSRPASTGRSASAGGARGSQGAGVPEEQLDARLDEVLAKIAREGRGGLTDEENRILQEASRRARNRRSDRV